MNDNLVSIIVPIYNARNFLEETIESVLHQTYKEWELLLIDDGSTDSSDEVAQNYARKLPARIRYLQHENHQNKGACASRNLGISEAKGEYVALLDSDDVWVPQKLEEQMAIFHSHPEVGMVYGTSLYWKSWTGNAEDAKGDIVSELGIPPDRVHAAPALVKLCYPLGKAPPPCPSDVLLRRSAVKRAGGFEDSWRGKYQLYEDQAFLVKIYLRESVYAADRCWDKYRIHPDSCVSVVTRAGQYDTVRLFFLNWFQQYLTDHRQNDPEVWKALRKSLAPYHHPTRHYLTKMLENAGTRVGTTVRAAGSVLSGALRWSFAPKIGMILAYPNPVQIAADSLAGSTKLFWTSKGASMVEVHVGAPDGPLFSNFSPSGRAATGDWVTDQMTFYLQDASADRSFSSENTLGKVTVSVILKNKMRTLSTKQSADPANRESTDAPSKTPDPGAVRFGDLRRTNPISPVWGFDRGTAIDRYYIENFLAENSRDVKGRVLEIDDNTYTLRFGGNQITKSDILTVNEGNAKATIVADLTDAPSIPSNTFDCIILTQALQFIYDVKAALRTLHRILKPGGVLLATFPGISRSWDPGWKDYWFWNFTPTSAQRLFEECFRSENIEMSTYGNVLVAISFLHGLAAEELQKEELRQKEKGFEILIAVRSTK